jgi:hypothetical protein
VFQRKTYSKAEKVLRKSREAVQIKAKTLNLLLVFFNSDSTRKISQAKAGNNLDGLSEESSCKTPLQ